MQEIQHTIKYEDSKATRQVALFNNYHAVKTKAKRYPTRDNMDQPQK
jgi:hypothetical protein